MHEAFWNGLFDVRWEEAPLGPEAIRLIQRLRGRGYAGRTCRIRASRRYRGPVRAWGPVRPGIAAAAGCRTRRFCRGSWCPVVLDARMLPRFRLRWLTG